MLLIIDVILILLFMTSTNQSIRGYIMLIIILFLLFISLLSITSFEKSIIYTNGLTHHKMPFIYQLFNRSFVPFSQIEWILYDMTSGDKLIYIYCLSKSNKAILPIFLRSDFESNNDSDDFIDTVFHYLKMNCEDRKFIKTRYEQRWKTINNIK